jgi:hypothetical protein
MCGGLCSSKNILMIIPKNRLIAGWHSIAPLSAIVAGARMFSSSLSSANDEISRRAFYGRLHCLVQVSRFAAVLPAMSLSHAPTE